MNTLINEKNNIWDIHKCLSLKLTSLYTALGPKIFSSGATYKAVPILPVCDVSTKISWIFVESISGMCL